MPIPASPTQCDVPNGVAGNRDLLLRRIRKWRRAPEQTGWLCVEACVSFKGGQYIYEVKHLTQEAGAVPQVVRCLTGKRPWPIYEAMMDGFGNGELQGYWESDERIPANEDPTGLFSEPAPCDVREMHPSVRRRRECGDQQA